jgi:hypothetical protein
MSDTASPALLPQHLQYLAARGIDRAAASAAKIYSSADSAEIGEMLNWNGPADQLGACLVLPYHDLAGKPTGYHVIRPDSPRRKRPAEANGQAAGPQLHDPKRGKLKVVKFEVPRGELNRLYIPPGTADRLAADPTAPVLITEGPVKALAGHLAGFIVVGLNGITGWSLRRTPEDKAAGYSRVLIPNLDQFNQLRGRKVYVVADSDARDNGDVEREAHALARALADRWSADARVAVLPCGPGGSKLGLDDFLEANRADKAAALAGVLKTAKKPPKAKAKATPRRPRDAGPGGGEAPGSPDSPYFLRGNRIWVRKFDKDGDDASYHLCNFAATIAEEMILDDGSGDVDVRLSITGTLESGQPLPPAKVLAAEFGPMNWTLPAWGSRAVVRAGLGAKDQLREAIQLLSPASARRHVYLQTGWRRIDNQWAYLTGGGAITATGKQADVDVELSGKLANYCLPESPTGDGLKEAVRASLDLLNLAEARIMAPGLGAAYRAPLGAIDGSLHFFGPTGAGKSELTALLQQHYGPAMRRLNLPGSWTSTANAIERQMFLAADALYVLDDFKPRGSRAEIDTWHAKADRVFTSAGNFSARGRCWANGSLRADNPPRCLLVTSGEDCPRGESCAARRLDVRIRGGKDPMARDVVLERLTPYQEQALAGVYARAQAGYISWLAGRLDKIREGLAQEHSRLRALAAQDGHPRTPGLVADLGVGWKLFLDFALEVGAVTSDERAALARRAWLGLLEAGARQGEEIAAHDPVRRFLELLSAAVATGRAHVAGATAGEAPEGAACWGWGPIPAGQCIGWVKGDDLFLCPESAYAVAQRLGEEQGERLPVSKGQLHKRLDEAGLLVSKEKGKLTNRRVVLGLERPVLHLHVRSLQGVYTPEKSGDSGDSGGTPQKTRENPPNPPPDFPGPPEKSGGEIGGFPRGKQAPPPNPPIPPISSGIYPPGAQEQNGPAGHSQSAPPPPPAGGASVPPQPDNSLPEGVRETPDGLRI